MVVVVMMTTTNMTLMTVTTMMVLMMMIMLNCYDDVVDDGGDDGEDDDGDDDDDNDDGDDDYGNRVMVSISGYMIVICPDSLLIAVVVVWWPQEPSEPLLEEISSNLFDVSSKTFLDALTFSGGLLALALVVGVAYEFLYYSRRRAKVAKQGESGIGFHRGLGSSRQCDQNGSTGDQKFSKLTT